MFAKLLAEQLSHPTGLVGRWALAPMWNRRNLALNDAALARLNLQPDDRVLEVGFGGGYLLGRMAEAIAAGSISGVDVSEAMVAACRQHYRPLIEAGRLDLRCAAAEALPYPPTQFDKACTVNSIFYWRDAPGAIAELWRVLKDNGLVVICFTCRESLQSKDFAQHGLSLFDADDVRQLLASAGFGQITAERLSDRHRQYWCMTARRPGSVGSDEALHTKALPHQGRVADPLPRNTHAETLRWRLAEL